MKAILISIKPKWCALMMNGIKKIEVRKGTALYKATQKLIEENGYAEFYVYCTKGKPNLWLPYEYDCFKLDEASQPYLSDKPIIHIDYKMNGKVIFKFRCYKVEEIKLPYTKFNSTEWVGCEKERKWQTPTMNEDKLLELSCLEELELYGYLKGKTSAAIHISDLEIFDRPRELGEFNNICPRKDERCHLCKYWVYNKIGTHGRCKNELTKAPQSWQFIEVGE